MNIEKIKENIQNINKDIFLYFKTRMLLHNQVNKDFNNYFGKNVNENDIRKELYKLYKKHGSFFEIKGKNKLDFGKKFKKIMNKYDDKSYFYILFLEDENNYGLFYVIKDVEKTQKNIEKFLVERWK